MVGPTVISVAAIEKHKIEVCFHDGTKGVYDLGHMEGRGVFWAWDDLNLFFNVFISPESGAITWPGELDIDTITVYCALKNISVDEYLNHKPQHAAY